MNNLKLKYLEIRNKIELINDNINKQLSTILIDDSALKNKLLFDFENELRVALELEKNKSQDEIQKELNKERISKESQVNTKKLNQYLVAINGFKTNLETKENFINEIDKPEIQNKIGGIKFEINKNKDLINNLTNKLEKELEKEIINNDDTNTLLQETEELKTKIDEVDKIFEKTKEIIEKESIGPVVEEPEISNEELEKARKDLFENKSKILNGFQFNFEKVQTLETFIQKHIYASENTLLDEFKTKLVTNQALKDTFENLKEKLNQKRNLPGVNFDLDNQVKNLSQFSYSEELNNLSFNFNNKFFEAGDAEIYYQIIRYFKPKKIIEIGSGHSSLLAKQAIKNNEKIDNVITKLTCIEPYENKWLEKNDIDVIRQKVEEIDIKIFNDLNKNDVLFIDSSHVIKPQGDIIKIFLEILPKLKPGVIIHIHDIFSPRDYPENWLKVENRFFNEQYLLEGILSHSSRYEILLSLNLLKNDYYNEIKKVCPFLTDKSEPSSFYIVVN